MKKFTLNDIRSWQLCYAPAELLPEDWSGTALDILENEEIPHEDRLWVILRTELVSEKLMRLFAVWCARQVLKPEHDQRLHAAVDVAERFANGNATADERSAVESAAECAAESAVKSAESAAWSMARSAAESAQRKKLREMLIAGPG